MAKTLTELFPKKKLRVIKKQNNDEKYIQSLVMNQIPDISKIKKLGYEPKISVKEGFLRTVKSYT